MGLGFTNPVGTGGDVALGCGGVGGVGGEWIGGLDHGVECVSCESELLV